MTAALVILSGAAFLFVLVEGTMLVVGGVNLRRWWRMRQMEPTDATNVTPGLTEVTGTVAGIDGETVRAPLTETESVFAEYEIEKRSSNGTEGGSTWETFETVTRSEPFVVEDATGAVEVHPKNVDTEVMEPEFREKVDDIGELPASVRAGLGRIHDDSPIDGHTRRVTERRVEPGESVYVVGEAHDPHEAEHIGTSIDAVVADSDPGGIVGRLPAPIGTHLDTQPFAVSNDESFARRQYFLGGAVMVGFTTVTVIMILLFFLS